MNTPKLSMHNVHKSFGAHNVLNGINLDIANGTVVTLIGPSGSGKSTLLRCLNLLEAIDDGEILLDGTDISVPGFDANPVRRRIGMVFQNFNLFPHMSVRDNITLSPIRSLGINKALARVKALELLERFCKTARAALGQDAQACGGDVATFEFHKPLGAVKIMAGNEIGQLTGLVMPCRGPSVSDAIHAKGEK